MPDQTLTLDPITHVYTLNGRVVPGVTEIVRATVPGWQASEWYLQRGRALHKAVELWNKGTLDEATVAPEIEGRFRAWKLFRE